jgi:phosphopentomutase
MMPAFSNPPTGMRRALMIVLDGAGIGFLPDADRYGDVGAATIPHVAAAVGGLRLPNLQRLGLGCIASIEGVPPAALPLASFGKAAELSAGKDTTTGHWELMCVLTEVPFPTYPDGFPQDLLAAFERAIGRGTLGNCVASGTEIIDRLGAEHVETGKPIVYTSADSVFQIAAHEEVIPLETLYDYCRVARRLLVPPHEVGRVIARPFLGTPGAFHRTANRHDFSLVPPDDTVLDLVRAAGLPVTGIGKIGDIFAMKGLDRSLPTKGNAAGMATTLAVVDERKSGFLFTNLVDFDMLYGHRNNPSGYASALEEFDAWLPDLLSRLEDGDLLILTADHGTDPCFPGTDHTREYVPALFFRPGKPGRNLGILESFADLGATVAAHLGSAPPQLGRNVFA